MKVYRPHLSEYFPPCFREKEKEKLESIKGVKYVYSWQESPNIVLTNTSTHIDKKKFKDVQLIVHPNSGQEPFRKSFVKDFKGIIVTGNIIRVQAVIQYILSCIFQRYVNPPFSLEWDTSRKWDRTLIDNLKILIIGYGYIGRQLEQVLHQLQSSPYIYDPWQGHKKMKNKDIDVVILCCSANPLNKHMIDESFLSKVSPDATIINTARGNLINESSLFYFLENNPESFAFLDVHEQEPFLSKKFSHLSNVATSSHVAGVFKFIQQKVIDFEYDVIRNFVLSKQTFSTCYAESILSPNSFVGEK